MRFISIVLVGKKPSFLIVANVRFCLDIGGGWETPKYDHCLTPRAASTPSDPGLRASLHQSDLNTLCYLQCILNLDTKVSHGTGHICVPQ